MKKNDRERASLVGHTQHKSRSVALGQSRCTPDRDKKPDLRWQQPHSSLSHLKCNRAPLAQIGFLNDITFISISITTHRRPSALFTRLVQFWLVNRQGQCFLWSDSSSRASVQPWHLLIQIIRSDEHTPTYTRARLSSLSPSSSNVIKRPLWWRIYDAGGAARSSGYGRQCGDLQGLVGDLVRFAHRERRMRRRNECTKYIVRAELWDSLSLECGPWLVGMMHCEWIVNATEKEIATLIGHIWM